MSPGPLEDIPVDANDRAERLDKLNKFLVDNDALEELNARLASFNLFHVLRIERTEIRHSNVLAWLLSPHESHGLGDALLRRFLSRILLDHEFKGVALTPARVELMELDDVDVQREWRNIDVLVTSRSGKWAILLENKLDSSEHSNQLQRYWKLVREEFGVIEMIPVFLTIDGDDPSEEGSNHGYVAMSYAEVQQIVSRVVSRHRSRIPEDARVLIDHYIETLRRITMDDPEIEKLCKEIYRRHHEAIDMIVEYGASSQVLDACAAEITKILGHEPFGRSKNFVFFLPKEHPNWVVSGMRGVWHSENQPVIWWFQEHRERGKLQVSMEVGPMADVDTRLALLERLRAAGLRISNSAFRRESLYTRVISFTAPLDRDRLDDPDDVASHIQEVTASLWEKAWARAQGALPILREFAERERRSAGGQRSP